MRHYRRAAVGRAVDDGHVAQRRVGVLDGDGGERREAVGRLAGGERVHGYRRRAGDYCRAGGALEIIKQVLTNIVFSVFHKCVYLGMVLAVKY